jgi:hypothetical protein
MLLCGRFPAMARCPGQCVSDDRAAPAEATQASRTEAKETGDPSRKFEWRSSITFRPPRQPPGNVI